MSGFLANPLAILIVLGLVLVYIGTYILNKRTPVPEECQDLFDKTTCNACANFTCSHKGK